MLPSVRITNLFIALACFAMILAAAYMEHVLKMIPCSLCITQRALVILTGLISFLAFLHNPRKNNYRIYSLVGILSSLLGAAFAGRQLWLQSLPADQVPACGPGLSYMFEVFPLLDALKLLLQGDGNCAHVDKIFGLSLAAWTLMAFIVLAGVNLYQLIRKDNKLA